VAALTMPALVANLKKHVIETRLQRVYSVMNQAVKMSELDNGDTAEWDSPPMDASIVDWYDKYYAPYLKTVKTEAVPNMLNTSQVAIAAYFSDGSVMAFTMGHSVYFPNAKDTAGYT
jgi:hypothetical protein